MKCQYNNEAGQKHWYALKVFFNKVFDIESILQEDNIECYIPCETVSINRNGTTKEERQTIIPSLMFFKSTENYARRLQRKLMGRVMLYTFLNNEGNKYPAAISDYEMSMFMIVTSAGDKGLEYFEFDKTMYKVGEKVRVTGGRFMGAEGYIKRVKRKLRMLVSIEGICMVATSYIPTCFLEKIED